MQRDAQAASVVNNANKLPWGHSHWLWQSHGLWDANGGGVDRQGAAMHQHSSARLLLLLLLLGANITDNEVPVLGLTRWLVAELQVDLIDAPLSAVGHGGRQGRHTVSQQQ